MDVVWIDLVGGLDLSHSPKKEDEDSELLRSLDCHPADVVQYRREVKAVVRNVEQNVERFFVGGQPEPDILAPRTRQCMSGSHTLCWARTCW